MDANNFKDLKIAALTYAARGWKVLPLHTVSNGICSCGRTDCPSPGKHPRIKNGHLGASSDREVIEAWWETMPDSNIGVATGLRSGFFALDVDFKSTGDVSLALLEKQFGRLPNSPTCISGFGYHIYFKCLDDNIKNSAGALGRGLDIRANGGYIVVPPSRHFSGRQYSWNHLYNPDRTPLADAPSWLSGVVTKPNEEFKLSVEKWRESDHPPKN